MSPSGTRQRPLDTLRQFTVAQSGHVLGAVERTRVGFMAVVGNRALPSTESARWSLLGEAERFAVRQVLRKAPEFLVQPDVAAQAGDGARARESFAIGAAARLIFQSAAKQ